MLWWILYVVGGLVSLVVLVAIVGMMLPKAHVASRAVTLKQPPESAWAAISDFEKEGAWRPDLKSIERLADQNAHPVWRERYRNGMSVPFEIVEASPPRRLVSKVADPKLPFGGNWTYEIAPAEGGCTVRVTENGEIRNPIFRFMAKFFFGHHATLEKYLRSLGKKFGEEVEPR